jgi:hypothetical protein
MHSVIMKRKEERKRKEEEIRVHTSAAYGNG